jgi:hypothetical protein
MLDCQQMELTAEQYLAVERVAASLQPCG